MIIKIYGADWCADCINLKRFLNQKNIPFEYIVVTENKEASDFIIKANNGKRIIPTIDINGRIYTNPGIKELMEIIDE
tara:strand:+ start:342 stop:575 length:234 start_codon:yes stop_codon:yes gene_type:complete